MYPFISNLILYFPGLSHSQTLLGLFQRKSFGGIFKGGPRWELPTISLAITFSCSQCSPYHSWHKSSFLLLKNLKLSYGFALFAWGILVSLNLNYSVNNSIGLRKKNHRFFNENNLFFYSSSSLSIGNSLACLSMCRETWHITIYTTMILAPTQNQLNKEEMKSLLSWGPWGNLDTQSSSGPSSCLK